MAKSERITIDGYEIWGLNVLETIGIGGRVTTFNSRGIQNVRFGQMIMTSETSLAQVGGR